MTTSTIPLRAWLGLGFLLLLAVVAILGLFLVGILAVDTFYAPFP